MTGKTNPAANDDSIAYLLRDTYAAFVQAFEDDLQTAGIGLSLWFLLRALAKVELLSQKQLMQRAGLLQQPATSAALKRMERLGLIVRHEDSVDRRKVRFSLTRQGLALIKRLGPAAAAIRQDAVRDFTPAEFAQLRRFLQRMQSNLQAGEA